MLKAGTIIVERYEIVGRIGSGGMADVYKAKDHKLNRFAAVKVLKKEFREDTNFIRKFRTEAQSAAGLAHPNIVNVYDVGDDKGVHFIVMELVEGITLKEYINKKGKMSVREATSIAIQVSMGLEAAHANGIVHRDVKPQNIIISTDGKVKVTDFGIARAASSNTISSNVMGSVHYSSPEQVRGGYSDAKSDIYSLGITMYEMVTGKIPFDGDTTVAIAIKHLQDEMEPPSTYAPTLPRSLEQIIYKCTQKGVDRRYHNMTEVIADLKRSLIEPDGNFVRLLPLNNHAQTVTITKDELDEIQKASAAKRGGAMPPAYATIDEEKYTRNQREERGLLDDEDEDFMDDDDTDTGISQKLEKALTIGGFVIGAIIICILIYFIGQAAGIFKFGDSKKADNAKEVTVDENKIEVPNLLGMTRDEATKAANDLGLGVNYVGEESSDQYAKGQIVKQSIAAGDKVAANTTIDITLSSGPTETVLTVPALVGKSEADAKAELEKLGLLAVVNTENSETVASGNVISVSPGEGTKLDAGDTVTLTVSSGTAVSPSTASGQEVKVPNVRGLLETDAKRILNNLGLVVKAISGESASLNKGDVVKQSIEADSTVTSGTVITLTINGTPTITDDAGGTSPAASTENSGAVQSNSGSWKSTSRLEEPRSYNGNVVKLELKQVVNGETTTTTLLEGDTISFPYTLEVTGATGVDSGTVTLYEMADGAYVERTTYGPLSFSQGN
ncbi:MAG TPA: Stk1 family PASTA domain-containing Ser/Thr kinase [Lachnospiraceae bacterium]